MSDLDPNNPWSPATDEELARIDPTTVSIRRLDLGDKWYQKDFWGIFLINEPRKLLRCAPDFNTLEYVINNRLVR